VLVIDDGSTDETAVQARSAGAIVISLPFNLGIGGAVQTGFLFARDNGYGAVAQVDGDGQHDPAAIEKLLARLQADPGLDMAYGSRFLESANAYRVPISRRIGISLFAFALTRFLRVPITDPTSGLRLCNRRAIEFFAQHYPHDYPEVEALLMLRVNGLRFAEVPVAMHPRAGGRSSITRLRSGYYMLKVTLALAAGLLREPLDLAGPVQKA
jgi:glycosyltransferase involved in cell wall biosynthesis